MATYTLKLSAREVLALDRYLTHKIGFIGHDDEADLAMHELSNHISALAEDARVQEEIALRETNDSDSTEAD